MNLQQFSSKRSFLISRKADSLSVLLVELEEIDEQMETLQQVRATLLDRIAQVEQQTCVSCS